MVRSRHQPRKPLSAEELTLVEKTRYPGTRNAER